MDELDARSALAACLAVAGMVLSPPGISHTQFGMSATPTPTSSEFVRGAYGKDSSPTGYQVMAANGFNSVMTGPYKELLDPLTTLGLKGVVWLGPWRNKPTCAFQRDDATVTSLVSAIAGHRAILAYYLGDEPHVSECPNAPRLFKKRSDLVHSLDAGSKTFTVIQASENGISHDYAPWAGSVDIIGFDVYPCARASATCNFGLIDAAIEAIKSAGITRYWAIPQDFQDCYYRLPTAQELATQFDHWARSDMSGYFVFSWNYQPADPTCVGASLDNHPDNVAELKHENSRAFAASSLTSARPSSGFGATSSVQLLLLLFFAAVLIGIAAVIWRTRRRPR